MRRLARAAQALDSAFDDRELRHRDADTFYKSVSKAPEFRRKTIIMSLHDALYLHYFDRVLLLENGILAGNPSPPPLI